MSLVPSCGAANLGGERIRDFDMVFEDGHEEPLEITLDAQQAVLQCGIGSTERTRSRRT